MDLKTTYMGLALKNPIVPSASSLCRELDNLKKMEEAGAGAVVLESLFEEQIVGESANLDRFLSSGEGLTAEAQSYFPVGDEYDKGPEEYLEHVRSAKEALSIPVIASLNGVSRGGWMKYAKKIEEAGADGLELNLYFIPTDTQMPGSEVEAMYLDAVRAVKDTVSIPVAVKLGPYFSNMAHFGCRVDQAGADAIVIFNRFYQPDLNIETLEVVPQLQLSSPAAMLLALRWVAILHGRIKADIAGTNGIHSCQHVVKMIMAGATVTQMASALYHSGIGHLKTVLAGLEEWMEEHDYESLGQMRGCLSQQKCPAPAAFERANYMKALMEYKK